MDPEELRFIIPEERLFEISLGQSLTSVYQSDFVDWRFYTNVDVELKYLTTLPDFDFKKSKFFHTRANEEDFSDLLTTLEHLTALLNIISNGLVILVFIRVIGLRRLPSKVLVNIAVCLLVEAIVNVIGMTKLTEKIFSDTVEFCRFFPHLRAATSILHYDVLTAGLIERIVALNVPNFYSQAIEILAPTIIVGPWLGFMINLTYLYFVFQDFDMGYDCDHHFNLWMPDNALNAGLAGALMVLLFVSIALCISLLFQTRKSGDVMEANRAKFEAKTSAVLVKILFLYLMFGLPRFLAVVLANPMRVGLARYVRAHIIAQHFKEFRGVSLLLVLLGRHDFSHQILLVFDSSENIRRNRTTNLLLISQKSFKDTTKRGHDEGSPTQRAPLPKLQAANLLTSAQDDSSTNLSFIAKIQGENLAPTDLNDPDNSWFTWVSPFPKPTSGES